MYSSDKIKDTLLNYRETFRETIIYDKIDRSDNHREVGMLLNSNEVWKSMTNEDTSRAVFSLNSGRLQKEFITLWELFDEKSRFKLCIKMLSLLANEIKKEKLYSCLVTCTPTARHITEHLHANIEIGEDRVDVHYLTHHPYFTIDNKPIFNFNGEDVLIVTDVLASGGLVSSMAQTIEQLGGNPVGVLSVIIVNEKYVDEPVIEYQIGAKKYCLRLYYLTDYHIPAIDQNSDEFDKDKIIQIDPRTVLPRQFLHKPINFDALIDEKEMFQHFEEVKAINFSFFELDERKMTLFIHIDRLFENQSIKSRIWSKISAFFDGDFTLVTTFNKDDLLFTDFIEREAGRSFQKVFISKKDSFTWSSSYFLLPKHGEKLHKDKTDVVLVLSSVNMAENLRNITSLLAYHEVSSITVVCLLNRMGPQTQNFILRIKKLMKGLCPSHENTAVFTFFAVYSITDIENDKITNMHRMIEQLLNQYQTSTRIPTFKRWIIQDKKYFHFSSTTSREFTEFKSPKLANPSLAEIPNKPGIKPLTQAGKAALQICYINESKDYSPILDDIKSIPQIISENITTLPVKGIIYRIFGILLCDYSYLLVNGTLENFRFELKKTIKKLREIRLNTDPVENGNIIQEIIERETQLVFGLAIFSYLDSNGDFENFVFEFLFGNKTPKEWLETREHLFYHFSDERIFYIISLLIYFHHPHFRNPNTAKDLKNKLIERCNLFKRTFQSEVENIGKLNIDNFTLVKNRIINNINFLLKEVGAYLEREKHEVIRYLQRMIIYVHSGHNPIISGISAVELEIESFLTKHVTDESTISISNKEGEKDLKKALEEALYSVSILEEISDSACELFQSVNAEYEKAKHFTAQIEFPGFAQNVKLLADLIEKIRIRNKLPRSALVSVRSYKTNIMEDLWDSKSYLRKILIEYCSPVYESIITAMKLANVNLEDEFSFSNVWDEEIAKFKQKIENQNEVYVLFNKSSFVEVLKNIFTNARYNLKGINPGKQINFSKYVTTDENKIAISNTNENVDKISPQYYELYVTSLGETLSDYNQDSTLANHINEVSEMDGQLKINNTKKGIYSGVTVTLRLRLRGKPIIIDKHYHR